MFTAYMLSVEPLKIAALSRPSLQLNCCMLQSCSVRQCGGCANCHASSAQTHYHAAVGVTLRIPLLWLFLSILSLSAPPFRTPLPSPSPSPCPSPPPCFTSRPCRTAACGGGSTHVVPSAASTPGSQASASTASTSATRQAGGRHARWHLAPSPSSTSWRQRGKGYGE